MANPSINVVDVKSEEKEEGNNEKQASKGDGVTPEDLLWIEILKTLDKLEKGVDGDLSALGRATRNINRFRKRFPSTTWLRILYTIIPTNYRQEFTDLLCLFIKDLPQQQLKLICNLVGVSQDDAARKLKANNEDVFKTLMEFIAEKEKLAKIEIKKKQEQLKKEREEREKKKTVVAKTEEKEEEKMQVVPDDKNKMEVDDDSADKEKKGEDSKDDNNLDDIKITLLPLRDRRQKRKFYPETYILLQLLIALELFDREQFAQSCSILERLIAFSKEQNRRTSDLLSSRLYQFYALCTQRQSGNNNNRFTAQFCQFLYDNYKTACLQQNESAQSVLIVLVLQYYIDNNLYSLAHKFVEKAEFPESSESQFFARYHYYRGRIDCVQLQYSNSLFHIQQSIRRAPQTGTYGFKINATRWLIVIQLLMGDIPDRNLFKPRFDGKDTNNPELNEALQPFLEITECVREGDLNRYQQCLQRYDALFKQCGLAKILLRLRHNVIKTGLRKINKSYSKISLQDVADKLALSSAKNAYFIVSKAIRDGVINASIDYDKQFVESRENVDVYSTSQPYQNYAQRIKFCLEIRNNAVTNLRYPANEDEEELNKKKKAQDDDDDMMTAEEIAEMIQKHHEDDAED